MAKGRRLTASRSERFLGTFGYNHDHGGAANGAPELGEDEVWSMVDEASGADDGHSSSGGEWSAGASGGCGRILPPAPPPPRADDGRRRRGQAGGLSLAFDDPGDGDSSLPRIVHQFRGQDGAAAESRHMATSAPVNVPDWSKIYRADSVESMHDSDENDDDSGLVPPHEYLARSRRMAANSVFEGVGRTLKGRDLSRVRDAVWSQTGFYG